MAESSTKVVYAALAGNVLVAASKFVAAALSGSSALLTEAIHSSADSVNQLLLLVGDHRSRKTADETHPYGYGKEIYFWTFVVAVMVLLAGGVASLYEGWRHFREPEPIESPVIGFCVLAAAAIFEGFSLRVGFREYKRLVRGRKVDGESIGIWTFIKLSKDPNLYESLLEDLAALVGIVFAAIGLAASVFLGWTWADGAASIAIGLLLVADSFVIAVATRSLIAGEAASPLLLERVMAAIDADGQRVGVLDVKTLQLGPRRVLMELTVRPSTAETSFATAASEFAGLIDTLKRLDCRIDPVLLRLEATAPAAD